MAAAKIKEYQLGAQRADPSIAGRNFAFHCPGCGCSHSFTVGSTCGPNWSWNGSFDAPTFNPSLFYPNIVCHSFVRDGKIMFLSDCTHKLAGQTVEIPEWDDE